MNHPFHRPPRGPINLGDINYTAEQINTLLGMIPHKADRAEVFPNDSYLGHFPTAENLPSGNRFAWAFVGDLDSAHPYFYYTKDFVPEGYQKGWNDMTEQFGTYQLAPGRPDELTAQELFKENFRLPQLTADRAIADEHGNRIADTYVSRQSVTKHIRNTYNQQFLENPPLITEGYITPQMLSDETRQLLEESGATINNLPDGEDLQSVHGVLKLANKQHNPNSYSGLGRQYLRKNIVAGQNILTQSMIQWPNTIYIIQYDYDLNEAEITIPEGCVLDFQGGSLSNGKIKVNQTLIKNNVANLFNIVIYGNLKNSYYSPILFGAIGDGVHDDTIPIQNCLNAAILEKKNIKIDSSDYIFKISAPLVIDGKDIPIEFNIDFGNSIIKTDNVINSLIDIDNSYYNTFGKFGTLNCIKNLQLDCTHVDNGITGTYLSRTLIHSLLIKNVKKVGINLKRGFQTTIENCEIQGDINYNDTIGIQMSTGDCACHNIILENCHTAIINGGQNIFYNIHGWLTHNIENSVFIDNYSEMIGQLLYSDTYYITIKQHYGTETIISGLNTYFNKNFYKREYSNPFVLFVDTEEDEFYSTTARISICNSDIKGMDDKNIILSNINDSTKDRTKYKNNLYGYVTQNILNRRTGITVNENFSVISDNSCKFENFIILNLKIKATNALSKNTDIAIGIVPKPQTDLFFSATIYGDEWKQSKSALSLQCPGFINKDNGTLYISFNDIIDRSENNYKYNFITINVVYPVMSVF